MVGGVVVLVLVALALFWPSTVTAPGEAITSIAVLPFVNMSDDPEMEYLSDGAAQSIIYGLSQLPQVRVIPFSSVLHYKGQDINSRQVAEELGVRALLIGRLNQQGDNLLVNIELVDTEVNSVLWGEQYNQKITELLAVIFVLYEMATGTAPFQGTTTAVVFDEILNKAPTAPVRLNPDLPDKLEDTINKSLEKDKNIRCQSAKELLTDLKRLKRDTSGESISAAVPAATPARGSYFWPVVAGGVAVVVLLALALFWPSTPTPPEEAITSIAVLPFVNMSNDPEMEYLSDGAAQSIIYGLSQLPQVRVIPFSSVLHYKGQDINSRQVAEELGVRALLIGRLNQQGDNLLVNIELVDTEVNSVLWGEQYNQKITELLAVIFVLYEMATGTAPFQGTTTAVVFDEILNKAPTAPVRLNPDLPDKLEDTINKSLEKDKNIRCQSAKELLTDLKRLKRDTSGESISAAVPAATPARGSYFWPVVAGGVAVVVLLALALFWPSTPTPPEEAITSIAVLPFVNMSNDPEMEYLSDGAAQSIIYGLSQLPQVRVIPFSSVLHYKGQDIDSQQVAKDLGVRALLIGRLNQQGDDLLVNVELVDTEVNSVLWGEQYNQKLTELLAVQEKIAMEISDNLRWQLSGEEQSKMTKQGLGWLEQQSLLFSLPLPCFGRLLLLRQRRP